MPTWLDWSDDRCPCLYSHHQARSNADFLAEVMGRKWLERGIIEPRPGREHPIQAHWRNAAVPSFLELNSLAENLGLLASAEGFEQLIEDLKRPAAYEPTLHVIRSAAVLCRSGQNQLARFFPASSESSPDFVLSAGEHQLAVEAKLLQTSDIQDGFSNWARAVLRAFRSRPARSERSADWLRIIVDDASKPPPVEEVLLACDRLPIAPVGYSPLLVLPSFRVLLGPLSVPAGGSQSNNARVVTILAPRSDREVLRVRTRAKKASKQLKSLGAGARSGLLCLGGVPSGHVAYTADLLKQRLLAGNYSAIGAVLMLNWHTVLGPEAYSVLERLLTITLPGDAGAFLSATLSVPQGQMQSLLAEDPDPHERAAYAFAEVYTERSGALSSDMTLYIPSSRTIPAGLLEPYDSMRAKGHLDGT